MKEQAIQNMIRVKLSELGIINFRNNTGMGWAGKAQKIRATGNILVQPGDVIVRNARPLHAGLCEGSSDIIGVKTVVITEDMIGQTVGIFVAPEVKTKKGKASAKQEIFMDNINKAGGIAGVVRSPEEAEELLG